VRAFVLSGGANLGAIQAGMVRALYERGIGPDVLVGTSVGALNAAFLAERPVAVDTADALGDVWRSVRRGDVFPVGAGAALRAITRSGGALVSDRGLRALAESQLGNARIEDAAIPLHIVATDALSGEQRCLSAGPLVDAVLASTALPGILPPVEWEGRQLFDGGVVENAPIPTAIAHGATTVYVLPTGHACALERLPRNSLSVAMHALTLLVHRQLIADIEAYRDAVDLVVLPPPCPLAVGPGDFSHADELIERSYADASAFLDAGGADAPPIRMHMHAHLG
jgi:NTE family protein